MSKTSEAIWDMHDRLADRRYWVKDKLFDTVLSDGTFATACMLGARLDQLTDKAAWLADGDEWAVNGEDSELDCCIQPDKVNEDPVNIAVYEAIKEQFPERVEFTPNSTFDNPWMGIPRFNDHDDTEHEDVMLVLTKAAIKADEVLS